jgi:hypothetical protein
VPSTPVRLTRRALEGGPAAPSNAFSVLTQGHAVTSGQRDRSSPSLSTLCDHPRHCRTMPGTVTTSRRCWGARGQDVATTATVPRTGPSSTTPSNRPTTAVGRPTATPPPTHREIAWHACKLLTPWPIKGGAVPNRRGHGTTDNNQPHALCLLHDIGTCLNQYLWDLDDRPLLPPRL